MKPKQNQKQDTDKSDLRDRCETPSYAVDPLLPYLNPLWQYWEPACGSGRIVRTLERHGYDVKGGDLLYGDNFFQQEPFRWDALITNPPYSIKPQWIKRCYELGKPFALLVPVETIGGGGVQKLMEQYGAEIMLLNRRVNFYMPIKGLTGKGAQFPVLWFCWKLLPAPIVYGKITQTPDEQMPLFEVPAEQQIEHMTLEEWAEEQYAAAEADE